MRLNLTPNLIFAPLLLVVTSFVILITANSAYGFLELSYEIYTDSIGRYSVSLPAGWFIRPAKVDSQWSVTTVSNYNKEVEMGTKLADRSKFSLDIVAFKKQNGQGLDMFIADYDKNNFEGTGAATTAVGQQEIKVGRLSGIRREAQSDYGLAWEVFLEGSERIYLFAASINPDFEVVFNQIVETFAIE